MTFLLLVAPAMGAILGLRFKAFVLAPAMLLVSAGTIVTGIAGSHDPGFIVLIVFAGLVLLQMGYFIGCILHGHLIFRHKERHRRPVWSPTHFH
jgi:hypothetical protein